MQRATFASSMAFVRRGLFAACAATMLVGCGESESTQAGDHVFEQVEAIETAKEVEDVLRRAASAQSEQAEEIE